ncbi:MAG: four helix bundle protein [Pirellulales bacterium]|nr:four helix bundle protein [Pirellulales bacterium]
MTYERFEEVPVWQVAADLAARLLLWTQQGIFRNKGDLAKQMQRAVLSISNNIAEGFERGTTKELLQYLYIARGSAGEVRSMLCVLERMLRLQSANPTGQNLKSKIANLRSQISDFQSEVAEYKAICESISRQIRGWANSLQNSDITGQRHLNDATRNKYQEQRRQTELDEKRRAWRTEFEQRLKCEAANRATANDGVEQDITPKDLAQKDSATEYRD